MSDYQHEVTTDGNVGNARKQGQDNVREIVQAIAKKKEKKAQKADDLFLSSSNIAVARVNEMRDHSSSYDVPQVHADENGSISIAQGAAITVASGYAATLLGRMFDFSDPAHPELVKDAA